MTSKTLYDILGVLEDASLGEIKAAYRRKMRHIHPDRGGSEDSAKQVNAAYDVLSDAQRRAEYDASRRDGAARCPVCDDSVRSEDELLGHLIRHRAEVEAAQVVIAQEAARPAAQPSQAARRAGVPKREDPKPSVPVEAVPGRSIPQTRSLQSTTMSWLRAIALIVFLTAAILVPFTLSQPSSDELPSSGSRATTSQTSTVRTEDEETKIPQGDGPTTTMVEQNSAVPGPDARMREFLALVAGLEANDRYVQAADGENWYLWTDEYRELASDYLSVAESWDRIWASLADRTSPGLGEFVSQGLLRRSDGYRLVAFASTSEAIDADVDSWYWQSGVEAMEEATALLDKAWSVLPTKWDPGASTRDLNAADIVISDLVQMDPIPIRRLVAGDCYIQPHTDQDVDSVPRSECTPGAVLVFWIEDLSLDFDAFPGEEHVREHVQELCPERAEARFPFTPENLTYWWWYPTAETWDVGDARVTCGFEI